MARFTAFLDACVLVPISLADTLLRLAEAGLYRPLWSDRILREMTLAVRKVHPDLSEETVGKRADSMRGSFEDALVTGWEPLEGGLELPDPDDRHVLAAALMGRADVIVTFNLRDFPSGILTRMGMTVQHPDDFLLDQLDLAPDLTVRTFHEQAAATRNPAITTKSLAERLARCGVPRFAAAAAQQLWRAY